MPSKKSKKKAAGNASRGFATQSIASKSKNPDSSVAESPDEQQLKSSEPASNIRHTGANPEPLAERAAVCELSPADLESHLEEAELQLMLEKHGDKVTKDATRHINRLLTEKRLFRPQADQLVVHSWLPDDLMQDVQSCINDFSSRAGTKSVPNSGIVREDVIIPRLWTLEKILLALNFTKDRAHEALQYVLHLKEDITIDQSSIWGLDECLEWLAASADIADIPNYDSRPVIDQAGSDSVPTGGEGSAGMFDMAPSGSRRFVKSSVRWSDTQLFLPRVTNSSFQCWCSAFWTSQNEFAFARNLVSRFRCSTNRETQ